MLIDRYDTTRRSEQSGERSVGQPVEYVNGKHAESSVLRVARLSLAKSYGLVASLGLTVDTVHVFAAAASSHLPVPAP